MRQGDDHEREHHTLCDSAWIITVGREFALPGQVGRRFILSRVFRNLRREPLRMVIGKKFCSVYKTIPLSLIEKTGIDPTSLAITAFYPFIKLLLKTTCFTCLAFLFVRPGTPADSTSHDRRIPSKKSGCRRRWATKSDSRRSPDRAWQE